jgi:Chromosome segregation ATPases
VLTRDGTSSYYINNLPARRRDIQDIFLGTGLGPRAYAIIGQGMIARLIEAKPKSCACSSKKPRACRSTRNAAARRRTACTTRARI